MTVFKSQLGQDRWVREHFIANQAMIVGETEPYFVEIGAHDGVQFSNTHYFEKQLGWNGICIEPNPSTFKLLKQNRGCICANLAISNASGKLPINFDVADPMLAGAQNGGLPIECDTITSVLSSYEAPKEITYMSIDVEGHEPFVLEGLDIEKFAPVMMTIEHNFCDENVSFIVRWLSERNYLFRFFHWDIFAIKDWAIWQ